MSTKNIYNPTTGQYGYQVPGSALPAGWQWTSGGGSTPAPAPSTPSTPAPTPSTPSSGGSNWVTYKGTEYNIGTSEGRDAYQKALTGQSAPAPTPAPSTPAPAPTTPSTPATPSQPAQNQPATNAEAPSVYLEPGMTGEDVKKLQDYLVAQGLMTQEQVNTGYGIYGPQTTAAVKSLQEKLGVDNSSGVGFFGPKTISAIKASIAPSTPSTSGENIGTYKGQPITKGSDAEIAAQMSKIDEAAKASSPAYTGEPAKPDTSTGKTPTQNVIDTWNSVVKELGLTSIKDQYDKTLKDQEAMQNDKDAEAEEINNNPWYSEGKRQAELKKLDTKYEKKLNTLSNYAKLYDSMYQEGISTAKYLVGQIEDDTQKAMEIAQKKQEALDALKKENIHSGTVNGRDVLIDFTTKKIVADLGPSKATSSTQGQEKTYRSGALVYGDNDIAEGQQKLETSRGGDGWVDPSIYLRMYQIWVDNGGKLQDFLTQYPPKNYVNPANEWLPDYLMPSGARKTQSEGITNPFQ